MLTSLTTRARLAAPATVALAAAALLLALALALAPAGSTTATAAPRAAGATELLPDLTQALPRDLSVRRTRGGRWHLGFFSAIENHGRGPLIISGFRPSGSSLMNATQVIRRRGASSWRVRGVGFLRFTRSSDHRHWHFLNFDRYSLLRPTDLRRVARDRKTGFCLGDRYRAGGPAQRAQFIGTVCGLGDPGRRTVLEGISVGWGDDYHAHLEGQSIEITRVPGGRYILLHRANADERIREVSYGNNAASLLISLRWDRSGPHIRVLRRCPGASDCGRSR